MNMKSENKNAKPEKNKSTFTIPNSVILPTSTPPGRQMLKTAGIAASCALGVTLAISVPIALNVQQSNANYGSYSTFNAKVQYINIPSEGSGNESNKAESGDEPETETTVKASTPNPPNLELLLRGDTETFFDYLRDLKDAYGTLAWSMNAIRLDHEGVQDESYSPLTLNASLTRIPIKDTITNRDKPNQGDLRCHKQVKTQVCDNHYVAEPHNHLFSLKSASFPNVVRGRK